MDSEKRPAILVVGGSGVVGRHVCGEVLRTLGPDALVVGDHKPERGREFAAAVGPGVRSVAVDVHRRETIEQALDEAGPLGAVIVSARQREPNVQVVCTNRGIHSVDMKVIAVIEDPDELKRILRHLIKIGRSPPGFDPDRLN